MLLSSLWGFSNPLEHIVVFFLSIFFFWILFSISFPNYGYQNWSCYQANYYYTEKTNKQTTTSTTTKTNNKSKHKKLSGSFLYLFLHSEVLLFSFAVSYWRRLMLGFLSNMNVFSELLKGEIITLHSFRLHDTHNFFLGCLIFH